MPESLGQGKLLALVNAAIAFLLGMLAVVSFLFLPEAWSQRAVEPEDVVLLVFWGIVLSIFSAAATANAWILFRGSQRRGNFLRMVAATLAALSGAIGLFGFVDPVLVFAWIPALVFAFSSRTLASAQDGQDRSSVATGA